LNIYADLTGNMNPIDPVLRNVSQRIRYVCNILDVDVNVTTNQTNVMVQSSVALDPVSPWTHVNFNGVTKAIDFVRFAARSDIVAASRFTLVFRKVIEFTPRPNASTDVDFMTHGFDDTVDLIEQVYDFLNATDADNLPQLDDFGSVDLDLNPANPLDTSSSFIRFFRYTIRFGPLRLSRLVIDAIVSNIRTAAGLTQVHIPGGITFNHILDAIPYTKDGTHFVFAFDIISDPNDVISYNESPTPFEQDPSLPNFSDNSEGAITFGANDTRRIRFRKIVFCENGVSLIIKVRVITVTENSVVIRRVYVTYYFNNIARCDRIILDPSGENANAPANPPVYYGTTGGNGGSTGGNGGSTGSNGGSTGSQGTGKGSTGTGSVVSCFFILIALVMFLF